LIYSRSLSYRFFIELERLAERNILFDLGLSLLEERFGELGLHQLLVVGRLLGALHILHYPPDIIFLRFEEILHRGILLAHGRPSEGWLAPLGLELLFPLLDHLLVL